MGLGKPDIAVTITVDSSKTKQLQTLATLSPDTLTILADLSKMPGIEAKLKSKLSLIKKLI